MVASLADKKPVRGAITVGAGGVLEDDSFYGPALAEAYQLENEVAQYPRVVVSNTVHQFVFDKRIYSDDPEVDKAMQSLADQCQSLICKDADGHWIVDFLGSGSAKLFRSIPQSVDTVKKAYGFVLEQIDQFTQSGDAKLAERYRMLKRYFEPQLPLWGISVSN